MKNTAEALASGNGLVPACTASMTYNQRQKERQPKILGELYNT